MQEIELKKSYNPKDFEDRIYQYWLNEDVFSPKDSDKGNFVIVIPPPNVTGVLHMGHGLNNSLQDLLVRYNRMLGKSTLWVPGTDHAGIATQNVVEKKLRSQGTSKHELGREKFVEETWKVKKEHHKTITNQLRKIGASCDWSRERFTLDKGLSKAVREVFVRLYEKGLIYRGNYLVNWCTSCGTALSDDEVEHKGVTGKIYHIDYPVFGEDQKLKIATTRPETMLGDTAVAVNPDDKRYSHLIGKYVELPLVNKKIPIIADVYVDMEFGTGALKITPGHDPNDFTIGNRHELEKVNILNAEGTLNENVPDKYRGMDVKSARKAVIEDLRNLDLFRGDEEHEHQVGHCYRCKTVIEPYLSDQWFVKMKPLAEKALKTWKQGNIKFYPKKWENTYTHWLKGIRDWCISRQLWWGHRIPVWYCKDCGSESVCRENPDVCTACGSSHIRQDTDVLDTWFSSWLWPFSTLGWPEDTEDMKRFFPTTALVTAYDIIFFWVARMIMASMEFLDEPPFRDIYIHQLLRDINGNKMSKSLGNGIDPIDVVDEFGADALKFTLAFLAAQGQDILLAEDTFKIGSKFANKIWNASRYILMNLKDRNLLDKEQITYTALDTWIYHRLNETSVRVKNAMEDYRFNDAAHAVYEYFWNDFCDWYIEASKVSLYTADDNEKDRAVTLLLTLLEEGLRLLHPFLSFISEEIYQKLPIGKGSIAVAPYPEYSSERVDNEVEKYFESLQELVRLVRTLRSEFGINPEKKVKLVVQYDKDFAGKQFFKEQSALISQLSGSEPFISDAKNEDKEGSIAVAGTGFEGFVYVKDVIDVPKEVERLKKDLKKEESQLEKTDKKLKNEKFLNKAPAEIVEKEKNKYEEMKSKITKMKKYIDNLS